MATADQIRAAAQAAVACSNVVAAAPGAVPSAPSVSTSDVVQPAPSSVAAAFAAVNTPAATGSLEGQITALQTQLAQALGVIATLRPAAPPVVGERTYHSSHPFVKIQVMKGPGICEGFQFKGHKLTTDDPAAIAFLEAAITSGDSHFSRQPVSDKPTMEEIDMRKDLLTAAVIARDKMVKAGESVA